MMTTNRGRHRLYSMPLIAAATYLQCCGGVDAFPLTHRQAVKSNTLMVHQDLLHRIRQSSTPSYRRRYTMAAENNSSSSDSFQEARLAEQLRQSSNSGGRVNIYEGDDIPLTSIDEVPTTTTAEMENDDTSINKKRDIFKQILSLFCHPMNFLIVTIFHILGVCQATTLLLSKLPSTLLAISNNNKNPLLLQLLMQPSMCIVLLSLLLITSMIKNCNYDSCYYENNNEVVNDATNNEPPFSINKRTFDTYLYAILLMLSSSISGSVPRILVSGGAIITYLYTTHLQTKFEGSRKWITNLGSAVLLTLSPLTSGLAACHVLSDASFLSKRGIFIGGESLDTDGLLSTLHSLPFDLMFKSPLSFMMIALFGVLMSRELAMDMINNESGTMKEGQVEEAESSRVEQERKQMASVVLGCTIVTAIAACTSSIIPFYNILMALITDSESRKAVLSVWGSTMLTWRAWRLWNSSKGEKKSVNNLAERAVREGLIYALMILFSFV